MRGRFFALLIAIGLASGPIAQAKIPAQQRAQIIRELAAEYGTAKVIIPRSKKPLGVTPKGTHDEDEWGDALDKFGPAARLGDLVQITNVKFKKKKLILVINHGIKGGRKWWHRVQVGGTMGQGTTLGRGQTVYAPGGTKLALVFDKEMPPLDPDELKKILKPILDFEQRSATELYIEKLPKKFQDAIKEKRVMEGMDTEMVLLAKGRPDRKVRDFKDGLETEDWIYGVPPGDITFITFEDGKVIEIKQAYATPGGQVGITAEPRGKE